MVAAASPVVAEGIAMTKVGVVVGLGAGLGEGDTRAPPLRACTAVEEEEEEEAVPTAPEAAVIVGALPSARDGRPKVGKVPAVQFTTPLTWTIMTTPSMGPV
jgi:hypothetical protein